MDSTTNEELNLIIDRDELNKTFNTQVGNELPQELKNKNSENDNPNLE